jgi:hypothetical protein
MRTMFLAAAAALSLGVGSAHADGGGQATTMFTMMQDQQQKVAPSPAMATQNGGAAVQTYVTRTHQGTWLFPPAQGGNG